ncbi:MAG: peptidase M28, partial [Bacteroidota bacterium]
MYRIAQLLLILLLCPIGLLAQEPVSGELNTVIKKHGLEQSQVMDIASWLCDVHGPRLTGSPQLDQATEWAVQRLKDWGLENVHTEEWGPFGRGWEMDHFEMHALVPNYFPIIAYPKAWSPATNGPIKGEVIYLDAATEEELQKYKGKLKGKFVMIDTLRELKEWFDPLAISSSFSESKREASGS